FPQLAAVGKGHCRLFQGHRTDSQSRSGGCADHQGLCLYDSLKWLRWPERLKMGTSTAAGKIPIMPDRTLVPVMRHLRTRVGAPAVAEPTDRELLEEFVRHRAEAAFETLVRRHGLMVQRLAQRLAPDSHDADEIFQATFLLLARKAASLS